MATRRKTGEHYIDENGNYRLGTGSTSSPSVSAPRVTTPKVDISNNMYDPFTAFTPQKRATESMTPTISVPERPAAASQEHSPTASGNYSRHEYESYTPTGGTYQRRDFTPGEEAQDYYSRLQDVEGGRPDAFQSRYEGAIQSILDGIMNRKPFDLKSDANYNLLYEQARQQAMAAGNRAMRDQLGASAALTGGYGSTAAQAAAGQAYDRYLEGLNDQNAQLMQLAYQMYGDDRADRYNQLSAVEGLDNTDYGRYRDTVADWMADRDYLANRYDSAYNRDWNRYQYEDTQDYDLWEYGQNLAYQRERDEIGDYDNAVNNALKFASAGLTAPERYASQLDDNTRQQLASLAAQTVAAQQAALAGGGRSGGGGGRSGNGYASSSDIKLADEYAMAGLPIPEALWQKLGIQSERGAEIWAEGRRANAGGGNQSNINVDYDDIVTMMQNGESKAVIDEAYKAAREYYIRTLPAGDRRNRALAMLKRATGRE